MFETRNGAIYSTKPRTPLCLTSQLKLRRSLITMNPCISITSQSFSLLRRRAEMALQCLISAAIWTLNFNHREADLFSWSGKTIFILVTGFLFFLHRA